MSSFFQSLLTIIVAVLDRIVCSPTRYILTFLAFFLIGPLIGILLFIGAYSDGRGLTIVDVAGILVIFFWFLYSLFYLIGFLRLLIFSKKLRFAIVWAGILSGYAVYWFFDMFFDFT